MPPSTIKSIYNQTRQLPYGAGSYSSDGTRQGFSAAQGGFSASGQTPPVTPVKPSIFTPTTVAPVAPVTTKSKYINPTTGGYYTPQEYADSVAMKMPVSKGTGAVGQYAGDAITNPDQTTEQMNRSAYGLNNARNDISTGETDPYDITQGGKIVYNPQERAAIEKAYAGIYDPVLSDVFSKLDAQAKKESSATEQKNKLELMAKQHEYNLAEQRDKAAAEGTSSEGEFAGTVDIVSNMESSVFGKKNTKDMLQNFIANKDYASAYSQIANSVEKSLTGVPKTSFMNARTDYGVMGGLKSAVEAYAKGNGDMNLLKGTEEEIKRKLGIDSGKASELATMLWREFQTYRNNMTGAAFGAGESRDYASVNPTLGKSLDLNLSVINGAQQQLKNRITETINQRVPSAQYILEYADGAQKSTGPAPVEPSGDPEYDAYLQTINQ